MIVRVLLFIAAAALGNALTSLANMSIGSPLFFDSIFTAMIGAVFGPWAGIATGLASHVFMEAFHDFNGLFMPFAVCNMATGFIVGSFARAGRLKTVLDCVVCMLLVTLANAVFGAAIAFFVFGGPTQHGSDSLVDSLIAISGGFLSASFWARIPANLIDKGIAVGAAWALAGYADRRAVPPSAPKELP